jgi:hypothetical protein
VARLAGNQQASRMTSTMMHGTIERTRGSLALNPNRKLAMILRRKNAPRRAEEHLHDGLKGGIPIAGKAIRPVDHLVGGPGSASR